MLVKDIIWKALVRLGVEDEYDKYSFDKTSDKRVSDLVFSLNTIVKEITTEYIPLRRSEEMPVLGGNIEYKNFSQHVVNIKSIVRNKAFVYFKDGVDSVRVFCKDGKVECEYDYSVGGLTIASELCLSRRISDELVVFGIMGDYCLTKGMLDSALTYDRRYRDALNLAMRDTTSRRVLARGWYD